MDTFMQLAMMVRFTLELESLTLMKKVLLGKLLLMFLKDPDIDKFLEASAKPMPLISTMRFIAEQVALILIQLVVTGNKSADNLCGSLSAMVLSFGASIMVMMSGTSC